MVSSRESAMTCPAGEVKGACTFQDDGAFSEQSLEEFCFRFRVERETMTASIIDLSRSVSRLVNRNAADEWIRDLSISRARRIQSSMKEKRLNSNINLDLLLLPLLLLLVR